MGQPSTSAPRPAAVQRRRRLTIVVVVVGVIAALLWWGWPSLTGADDDAPVLVVLDPALAPSAPVFEKALRERGRRARVVVVEGGWCGVTPQTVAGDASLRVMVVDPVPGCDPWADIADDRRWWWVAPSGSEPSNPVPERVTLLDVTWTVGDGGTLRRACEWWDLCEADGQVTVRSEPGVLTAAGAQRIARTVAVLR